MKINIDNANYWSAFPLVLKQRISVKTSVKQAASSKFKLVNSGQVFSFKMSGQYSLLKRITILLCLITCSTAQAPIAFQDTCRNEQNIEDNLSCPTLALTCLSRSELCDGTSACPNGADEGGALLNTLNCE